jgi:hypothetical protein
LLDTKEKRALSQQDIFESAANIVGPMIKLITLFKSPDIATKVIKTYFDLPQLLFHLVPDSDAKKITVIWADWALDSLQAIAVSSTGVVPTSMLILPE